MGETCVLKMYKTQDNRLIPIEFAEDGCWISAIDPSEAELNFLVNQIGLDKGFVRSALDEEETSRIESEDGQTVVIVDVPYAEKQSENTVVYATMPLGIVMTERYIVTICIRSNPVITEFSDGLVRNVQTGLKTRFLLMMLLRIAVRYLQHLKQIDKISSYMELQLHRSMRNKELFQLLDLEKSLVYFSTSLKANEVTMEKILRGRIIKLYEEDQDLLEDVLIETKQAIEMCNIYSSILSGTMDAFASIISNNLNIVMKVLTSLTIVMAIPTMVFSFYGMNVTHLPLANSWFPIVLSAVSAAAAVIILVKKDMFH
jgi:magnesium transporter